MNTTAPIRAAIKGLRQAGIDLTQPFLYFGDSRKGPTAEGIRFERNEVTITGSAGITADGTRRGLGGVATKFWAAQAPAAEATPAQGDELDGLKFAELMTIAKALKVPGRGTARIGALREGIRAARKAA